jgi:hypothetical protein
MQGASNQFVFQSSSASISNMIAAAHHKEGGTNLPTETTDNGTDCDNNLTQAMMMMAGDQGSHLMYNGEGMFEMSSVNNNNSRIPGKISKIK